MTFTFRSAIDAAGTKTFLKLIMDAAALRIQGMSPAALKAEKPIQDQDLHGSGTNGCLVHGCADSAHLDALRRAIADRADAPPDVLRAEDHQRTDWSSARRRPYYPVTFKEGIPEQTYIIQIMGEAEIARIVADGKALLAGLCAYRDVLCVPRH